MAYSSDFKAPQVTTNSLTIFDEEGVMLKLAFLDDTLSLQLGVPEMVEGRRKYPPEKRQSLIITKERVAALYSICTGKNSKVLNAIENGNSYDAGVFTSKRKDGILEIMVQEGTPYLVLYKDIDEDRKPKQTFLFKFEETVIIEKYDVKTTDFTQSSIHAYFTLFIKLLESFVLLSNDMSTHSFRHANKYTTDKIFQDLMEIAKKLGVTFESKYSNNSTPQNSGAFDNELPFGTTGSILPDINDVGSLDGLLD